MMNKKSNKKSESSSNTNTNPNNSNNNNTNNNVQADDSAKYNSGKNTQETGSVESSSLASSSSSVNSSPTSNNQQNTNPNEISNNNNSNMNSEHSSLDAQLATQIQQHQLQQQQQQHMPYYYPYIQAAATGQYPSSLDLNSAAGWPQAMAAAAMAMAAANDPMTVAAYMNAAGYQPDLASQYDQFSFTYPPTFSYGYGNPTIDYTHNPAIPQAIWTATPSTNPSVPTSPVQQSASENMSSLSVQHTNDLGSSQAQLSPIDGYQTSGYRGNNYSGRQNIGNTMNNTNSANGNTYQKQNYYNSQKNNYYNNSNGYYGTNKLENDFNSISLNESKALNKNTNRPSSRYNSSQKYSNSKRYNNNGYNNYNNYYNNNNNNANGNYDANDENEPVVANGANEYESNNTLSNSESEKVLLNDLNDMTVNNNNENVDGLAKSDSKTWASIVGHPQYQQKLNNKQRAYQTTDSSSTTMPNSESTTISQQAQKQENQENNFSSYRPSSENYNNYNKNAFKPRKYNYYNNNNYNQNQEQQSQIIEFNLNNGAFPPINSNMNQIEEEIAQIDSKTSNSNDSTDAQQQTKNLASFSLNYKNNDYKRQQYNNYQRQQQKQFGTNLTNLNRQNQDAFEPENEALPDPNMYQPGNTNQSRNNNYNSNTNENTDDNEYSYYYKRHQPSQLNISSFMTNLDKSLFIESKNSANNIDTANSNTTTTVTLNPNNKASNSNADKNDYQVNINIRSQMLDVQSYNPIEFNTSPKAARFFVIKSYSEDDVYISIKYNVWCSTEHGNRRLDSAYAKGEGNTPVYLFFSVNGSGHFCGMAEMTSRVDYNRKTDLWSQDKWRGCFQVKWIFVKDVPNSLLRNIKLENNDNKPVTNSRDTQEIPFDKGKQVLKVFHTYNHSSSMFDDFEHYEKRQDEENLKNLQSDSNELKVDSHSNSNLASCNNNANSNKNDTSSCSISSPYSSSSYSSHSTNHSTENFNNPNDQQQEQLQQEKHQNTEFQQNLIEASSSS